MNTKEPTKEEIRVCKRIAEIVSAMRYNWVESKTILVEQLKIRKCPYSVQVPNWLIETGVLNRVLPGSKTYFSFQFELSDTWGWKTIYPQYAEYKITQNAAKRAKRAEEREIKKNNPDIFKTLKTLKPIPEGLFEEPLRGIISFKNFSSQELVDELRLRGYEVTCEKTTKIIL